MSKFKIFLIAGEVSGDYCGSLLVKSLKNLYKGDLEIQGVGGAYLEKAGLNSIFPISEISVMGISEVVPKIFKISKLIKLTEQAIKDFNPDVVITIDSPGFCFRVIKRIAYMRNNKTKFVHYVSPSVWAYKSSRAKWMAQYYDAVMALLPFEPEYYEGTGLRCHYVGHHLVESDWDHCDGSEFRKRNDLSKTDKLIGVFVGSRKTEVMKMLPCFVGALKKFSSTNPGYIYVFPVVSANIKEIVSDYLDNTGLEFKVVQVSDEKEKLDMMKSFHIGLVKSGTSSLEMTFAKVPMIVAYKVSGVTYAVARYIFKIAQNIKFISLTNLVLNRMVIPEFIQKNCTIDNLSEGLQKLVDPEFRKSQISGYEEAIKILHADQSKKPTEKAALEIIELQK